MAGILDSGHSQEPLEGLVHVFIKLTRVPDLSINRANPDFWLNMARIVSLECITAPNSTRLLTEIAVLDQDPIYVTESVEEVLELIGSCL